MKPPKFSYHAPLLLDEVVQLLVRYQGNARLLAGGQSLVPMLNPPPLTDTLLPPVVPSLLHPAPDTPPTSYDAPSDIVPARSPPVTDTRRLPSMPAPALTTTDVSDTHALDSDPVAPTRP